MTAIAASQYVGARICDLLGLRSDRTGQLTINFPPGGAVEVRAVMYVDELTMDGITGELATEMKSYRLVPIEPEPLSGP